MSDQFLRERVLEHKEYQHSAKESVRFPLYDKSAIEQLRDKVLPTHTDGTYTYVGRLAIYDQGRIYDRTNKDITDELTEIAKKASEFRGGAGRQR